MGMFGGGVEQKMKRWVRVTESRLRNRPTVQPSSPELPISEDEEVRDGHRIAVSGIPSMRTLIGWDLGEGEK